MLTDQATYVPHYFDISFQVKVAGTCAKLGLRLYLEGFVCKVGSISCFCRACGQVKGNKYEVEITIRELFLAMPPLGMRISRLRMSDS